MTIHSYAMETAALLRERFEEVNEVFSRVSGATTLGSVE
jgi:hypothetical protein